MILLIISVIGLDAALILLKAADDQKKKRDAERARAKFKATCDAKASI
jgi:hypothetical protein